MFLSKRTSFDDMVLWYGIVWSVSHHWLLFFINYLHLNSPQIPEDPAGYQAEIDEADPEPVNVEHKKRTKKRKSSSSKPSGSKKAKAKPARPPAGPLRSERTLDVEIVLESFSEAYRAIIRALPTCLWPSSDKHGEHSYTVFLAFVLMYLSSIYV